MRYFFVIVALLYCSLTQSQDKKVDSLDVESGFGCTEKKIIEERRSRCTAIETDAQVKSKEHWLNYLGKNLAINSMVQKTIPLGIYSITAIFIIDREGHITNVKVQNDPGYGLGNKVIDVISCYNEKWSPATRNGRNVKAYKKQVVTIVVENTKCNQQEEVREFIL